MDSAPNTNKGVKKTESSPFKSLQALKPTSGSPKFYDFYKSILFNNQMMVFGKPVDSFLSFQQPTLAFDPKTRSWKDIKIEGSSYLAGNQESYSICSTQDQMILFGCSRQLMYLPQGRRKGWNGGICIFNDVPDGSKSETGIFDWGQSNTNHQGNVERLVKKENGEMKWIQNKNETFTPICAFHSANVFGNRMYVFGGLSTSNQPTNDLYEYSLELKRWKQIFISKDGPGARCLHSTYLHKENLFLFGGVGIKTRFNDLWSLNLKNQVWTQHIPKTRVVPPLCSPTFLFVFENKILVFGGKDPKVHTNDIFCFDRDSSMWESFITEELPNIKSPSCSVTLHNNEFIIQNGSELHQLSLDMSKFREKEIDQLSDLSQQMKNLFTEMSSYDVKFKVEDKELPAYKGILMARCPYFAKVFTSGMKESQDQIIDVPNIKYEVYYKLIEYLYCGQIELTDETGAELLKLSDEYSIPALKIQCMKFLAIRLDSENFVEFAQLAETYQAKELQEAVLDFFALFKSTLLQKISIKDLPRELLEEYILNSS